jgi:hypothetical protein
VPDLFPGNFVETVEDLRRRVEELEALLNARKPLTSASQGWRMANMTIPSVSAGEIHVGSNDDALFVQTSSGTTRLPAVPGAAPTYPGSFSSPATVSGTVQDTHYNQLRADVVAHLHGPLRDLIEKGRTTGGGSGLWLPS